jgi:hypothetical protein
VRWQRFADHFPWRITVLLALLFGLQSLSLWTWFRWEVRPLQRYYFWAYFNCTEGAKQANTQTRIQWLFNTALGRKHQVIIEADVVSGRDADLPVQLGPSARANGWTGIEKSSPQWDNSAELEEFLREDFYGHRGFWRLVAEPLLDGCVLLLVPVFLVFVMKEELVLEWSRLRRVVAEEASESDHAWDSSANQRRITECIRLRMVRWKWLQNLRPRRASPALDTSCNADANWVPTAGIFGGDQALLSALIPHANSGAKPIGKTVSAHPMKKPIKRQSIFPGRAGVRASNRKPKPWDESQWID